MMKEPHNPFTMRSSESIESRLTFLKLFGYGVLEMLSDDCFLNKTTIFRSGPGGGKTSLFRLFNPDSLQEISNHPSDYKDLSQSLKQYEVMSENGPTLLGVYLRLTDYGAFQDLQTSHEKKSQYFFSLIGCRLILKTLLGILELKNMTAKDLDQITIGNPVGVILPRLTLPCSGKELYTWASTMERNICGIVNRFNSPENDENENLVDLDFLRILDPKNISFDGKKIITKTLIMLDDVHELRKQQRELLLKIVCKRLPMSIWLAERLEALDLPDLVPGIQGREYKEIFLEQVWEDKRKSFEAFVKSISSKRVEMAKLDFEMSPLHQHLEDTIDAPSRNSQFKQISDDIKNRLHSITLRTSAYDKWIDSQEAKIQSAVDNSIGWRSLEIKVVRQEKNVQTALFDMPIESEIDDSDTGLKAAAELFLYHEHHIPYYFGFEKISQLSTYNIDQFLEIASRLFDDAVSQRIKDKKHNLLSAEKQHAVIKDVAKSHWEQIRKKIRNGKDITTFLTNFKKFALKQTLQPNAPYVPGVTGIAISKKQYDELIDHWNQDSNKNYVRLAEILQTCISHNLLKVAYNAKQGKRGNEVTLLYLNRLLCAHFDLPLNKGGWRKKTLDDLCDWLERRSDN